MTSCGHTQAFPVVTLRQQGSSLGHTDRDLLTWGHLTHSPLRRTEGLGNLKQCLIGTALNGGARAMDVMLMV